MSRNGNGVYTLPAGNPVVTGTTISSTWANTTLSDIATALTQSVAYDGQTTIQADLPMSSHKFTGLSQGSAATDSANLKQIQNSAYTYLLNVSGVNTITADASPTLTEYTKGQTFRFVASGTNNGAVTLNIGGLGAVAITKNGSFGLEGFEINSGAMVSVTYDGSTFQLECINTTDPNFDSVSANTIGCTNLSATILTGIQSFNGLSSINSGQIGGLRNRLINGSFPIDQRNSGAAQTFTAGGALAYCVDRWYGYCTGANVNGQRVAGAGSSRYQYKFTGAASVTKIGFAQRIEADNSYDMNNCATMICVDMSNDLLTTANYNVWYANTADTFGTLASPTRTLIATGSFSIDSSLSRYFIPIFIPSAATTGIEIEFNVGAQTSGTWNIGDVQFVLGDGMETYFEQRPVGLEQLLCQRYCNVYHQNDYLGCGSTNSSAACSLVIQYPTRMRVSATFIANPTSNPFVIIQGVNVTSSINSYTPSSSNSDVTTMNISWTGFTPTGMVQVYMNSSHQLTISAEL